MALRRVVYGGLEVAVAVGVEVYVAVFVEVTVGVTVGVGVRVGEGVLLGETVGVGEGVVFGLLKIASCSTSRMRFMPAGISSCTARTWMDIENSLVSLLLFLSVRCWEKLVAIATTAVPNVPAAATEAKVWSAEVDSAAVTLLILALKLMSTDSIRKNGMGTMVSMGTAIVFWMRCPVFASVELYENSTYSVSPPRAGSPSFAGSAEGLNPTCLMKSMEVFEATF